jgi:spermidine synthase
LTNPRGPDSWFGEPERAGYRQLFLVRGELYRGRSPFQEICVVETVPFGRSLLLDGAVQTTEADEFIYHEMLVHVPLLMHPSPLDVLIIGGGDGGAVRRALEHGVRSVVQVEIDEEVVEVSRTFLPSLSGGAYDDPRVNLTIGDGVDYVARCQDCVFDAVLVDSTDPVGPAKALFSFEFFREVYRVLKAGGVFVTQSGSPLLMAAEFRDAYAALTRAFGRCQPYLASVPSYPGVVWSFLFATREPFQWPDRETLLQRWDARQISGWYCTPFVALSAFVLPKFLTDELNSAVSAHRPILV